MRKLVIILFCSFSCNNDEVIPENHILGPWDSYMIIWDNGDVTMGHTESILGHYEQGIDILENGTYLSRYIIPEGFVSKLPTGAWEAKNSFITFSDSLHSVSFEIAKLDEGELRLKTGNATICFQKGK